MGNPRRDAKGIVRKRAGGLCERCGTELLPNIHGKATSGSCRSIHHRQPRRAGGRDSVVCMVDICRDCHDEIHANEDAAALDGWIVIGRSPALQPFRGHLGWVLPRSDGGLVHLDFGLGRIDPEALPSRTSRSRRRAASRPQFDRRRKLSRKIA